MQVKLFSQYEVLAPHAAAWNSLTRGVPFLRWEWLGAWWRQYGRGRQLFVLAVLDKDQAICGFAPWFVEARPALGRVVQFLGTGEVCTDHLSLLAAPGQETAVADAVAAWLAAGDEREGRWDMLELDGVVIDDPAVWRLVEQLAAQGNTVHRRDGLNCWRIELPATWEEYLQRQSKSHRKQIRQSLGRLRQDDRVAMRTVATAEEFARAWPLFVELHQRRRHSLGERGCFASKRFHDFLRDASEQLLAAQVLRLHVLELEGRPIAAEHALREGGVDYVYQAGLDPDYLREEPGRLTTTALIHGAVADGMHGYDFLRGDEPYKAHWRAQPRRLVTWRVVPRRAIPQLRHSAWLAGGAMKHWLRDAYHRFSSNQTSS